MSKFDAKTVKDECVQWIKDWFDANGKGCNAVIGISGGKDSSVVAALCCEALGKDRVIGVLMPQGVQSDIDVSLKLVDYLGIKSLMVNIGESVAALHNAANSNGIQLSRQSILNLPPRIRMSSLYMVSQSMNGRVAGTSNLSEVHIGWQTRFGDSVADFEPIIDLTVTEVIELGKELGLPNEFVCKAPSDGLTSVTDEENFEFFTYEQLDNYIRFGAIDSMLAKNKIDEMHSKNLFKQKDIPKFTYSK